MIPRQLSITIKKFAREYPILAVVGPRQSGKTTLTKQLFPRHTYLSLENLDLRAYAEDDPRGLLADYGPKIILDEIQKTPKLFSYLQEQVDNHPIPSSYILTGSQQFLLMEKVSQSLAGRIALFKLFPFTTTELIFKQLDISVEKIFQFKNRVFNTSLDNLLVTGFYPRIHDKKLTPTKWIENYILTYIEKDIRQLSNITDLRVFENFLRLCAAYSGQLTNYATFSERLGVSQPTIKKWFSLLETSGIIFMLAPHSKNFTKRVIKTPKLYFIDTGILCYLLSIKNSEHLKNHPLYGQIFETFVISEFYKRISHLGEIPPLYFWRDKTGHEIDLLIDSGKNLLPVEIKASQTFSSGFNSGLKKWLNLKGNTTKRSIVLYAGQQSYGKNSENSAFPWWKL